MICGIDEAGRGPVIGPLVIAGVSVNESQEKKLIDIGVKDSKLLSPASRIHKFSQINDIAKDNMVIVCSCGEVDNEIQKTNLNILEAKISAKIIMHLKPREAILDCPSNNIPAYTQTMRSILGQKFNSLKLVCEHKADFKYPVVAAASILAKVTRDREIENIKNEIGYDFGSGYPSDPRTIAFLKKHYRDFDIFRKTWATYKKVAVGRKQSNLMGFDSN
jgi:ribonuclease HII